MHRRLAELVDYVEAQRAVLHSAVALVPPPRRDQRVTRDAWSLAEVLEHLYRVERGVARLMARSVESAKAAGIGPERETTSMMGSLDAFHLTDPARHAAAPEPVLPRGEYTAAGALAALAESRQALLSALGAGNGLALGEIAHSHLLLGPLNLYQWVLFVGQHEARHADQVRGIARLVGESISPGP